MQESEEVKVRREETSEMLQVSNKQTCHTIMCQYITQALQKASDILSEIRDLQFGSTLSSKLT